MLEIFLAQKLTEIGPIKPKIAGAHRTCKSKKKADLKKPFAAH